MDGDPSGGNLRRLIEEQGSAGALQSLRERRVRFHGWFAHRCEQSDFGWVALCEAVAFGEMRVERGERIPDRIVQAVHRLRRLESFLSFHRWSFDSYSFDARTIYAAREIRAIRM